MPKIIEVGSRLSYLITAPTSFLFQVAVAETDHQRIISESLEVLPANTPEACNVGQLGNRLHRLVAQNGEFTLWYRATVELHQDVMDARQLDEVSHHELPADVLIFLHPSRYCESDRLLQFAWDEFGNVQPGYYRVLHIVNWVNAYLSYQPGSTGPGTTACDVLVQRCGVCRDYAHLAIALCRAMGIPARYVAGYAVDLQPPDFHGFLEVYLGQDWILFDATYLAPVSGLVRIGAGRDAADLSFATRIGCADATSMEVWAWDAPGSDSPTKRLENSEAISSA